MLGASSNTRIAASPDGPASLGPPADPSAVVDPPDPVTPADPGEPPVPRDPPAPRDPPDPVDAPPKPFEPPSIALVWPPDPAAVPPVPAADRAGELPQPAQGAASASQQTPWAIHLEVFDMCAPVGSDSVEAFIASRRAPLLDAPIRSTCAQGQLTGAVDLMKVGNIPFAELRTPLCAVWPLVVTESCALVPLASSNFR